MVGVAGLEPTVSGSKPDALPTWLYPCIVHTDTLNNSYLKCYYLTSHLIAII